jgi:hypothetical protein
MSPHAVRSPHQYPDPTRTVSRPHKHEPSLHDGMNTYIFTLAQRTSNLEGFELSEFCSSIWSEGLSEGGVLGAGRGPGGQGARGMERERSGSGRDGDGGTGLDWILGEGGRF